MQVPALDLLPLFALPPPSEIRRTFPDNRDYRSTSPPLGGGKLSRISPGGTRFSCGILHPPFLPLGALPVKRNFPRTDPRHLVHPPRRRRASSRLVPFVAGPWEAGALRARVASAFPTRSPPGARPVRLPAGASRLPTGGPLRAPSAPFWALQRARSPYFRRAAHLQRFAFSPILAPWNGMPLSPPLAPLPAWCLLTPGGDPFSLFSGPGPSRGTAIAWRRVHPTAPHPTF